MDTPVLPAESFAALAAELAQIARDKAIAAEEGEIMVAAIEARGEADTGAPLKLTGMRKSVADLQRRALMAGRAAQIFRALAGREGEVREMIASFPTDASGRGELEHCSSGSSRNPGSHNTF
jgi:hypothetical protein